jgi:hypothetical protein
VAGTTTGDVNPTDGITTVDGAETHELTGTETTFDNGTALIKIDGTENGTFDH